MAVVDTTSASMMSQAEYARHRNCSREAVRRAIEAGRISAWGDDKLINAKLADAEWAQNTRTRASSKPASETSADRQGEGQGGAASGGEGDYWASRTRREKAEADMAELKLQEQLGELVRAADIRSAYARRAAGLREALMQIPARLAPVLAAETDAGAIHDQLQAELRQVLEQLTEA